MKKIYMIFGLMCIIILGFMIISHIPKDDGIGELPFPWLSTIKASYVSENQTMELMSGWNMISLPETTNKSNVIITFNDTQYTWEEANNEFVIYGDYLATFEDGEYVLSNIFYKNKGYFLFSFEDNVFLSINESNLYCSKIFFNGTENIVCDKLIMNPDFDNIIYCNSITYNSYIWECDDEGYIEMDE